MQVISFVSASGGVGKTLFSILTAGAMAIKGKKVLLVDFDPSAAATLYLLRDSDVQCSVRDVLKDLVDVYRGARAGRTIEVAQCLRLHRVVGQESAVFKILPGGNVDDIRSDIQSVANWHRLLSEAIYSIKEKEINYVVVDAPNWVFPLFPMTVHLTSFYVVLTRVSESEIQRTKVFLRRIFNTMRNAFKIEQPELYALVLFNQFRSNMQGGDIEKRAKEAMKALRSDFPQLRVVHSEERDHYYGPKVASGFWGFKYSDRLTIDHYLEEGHPMAARGEAERPIRLQFEKYFNFLESYLEETAPFVIE